MYYAIHQPENSQGVYMTWKEVAPKVLGVKHSKYKKFRTKYGAKYWSKHGKCRKIIFHTCVKDYADACNIRANDIT